MNTNIGKYYLCIAFIQICLMHYALCQHISFTPLAGSNSITINPGFPNNLVFDHLLIDSHVTRSIALESPDAAWLEIEAPAHYDITVNINWDTTPGKLKNTFHPEASIPFKLNVAYANQGETNVVQAKNNAVTIPYGIYTASFPVNRRTNGLPPPPPTPEFEGYSVPTDTVWMFFFGEIGPTSEGNMVTPGSYEADLTVTIYFSTYD